jgi:hypothetical protein
VNDSVPPMLDLILARALEKEPDARYQNAAELAADLRACLAEFPDASDESPVFPGSNGKLDLEFETTDGAPAETERTAPRDPGAALSALNVAAGISTVTGLYLAISRRFDSAEALKQLTAQAAGRDSPDQVPGRPSTLARLWRDPDRNTFVAAIATATLGALVIAIV